MSIFDDLNYELPPNKYEVQKLEQPPAGEKKTIHAGGERKAPELVTLHASFKRISPGGDVSYLIDYGNGVGQIYDDERSQLLAPSDMQLILESSRFEELETPVAISVRKSVVTAMMDTALIEKQRHARYPISPVSTADGRTPQAADTNRRVQITRTLEDGGVIRE